MIYVNTLRYRMSRYEQLTGADLNDLDDLLGLAWAVEMPLQEAHPS